MLVTDLLTVLETLLRATNLCTYESFHNAMPLITAVHYIFELLYQHNLVILQNSSVPKLIL